MLAGVVPSPTIRNVFECQRQLSQVDHRLGLW
jgi:hypothetical protein